MANLKFGVVGCGRIGKLHINNLLNNIDGAEVVAAAALNPSLQVSYPSISRLFIFSAFLRFSLAKFSE